MTNSLDKLTEQLISTLKDIRELSEVDRTLALSYLIDKLSQTLTSRTNSK